MGSEFEEARSDLIDLKVSDAVVVDFVRHRIHAAIKSPSRDRET